jgi:hypothetical protein
MCIYIYSSIMLYMYIILYIQMGFPLSCLVTGGWENGFYSNKDMFAYHYLIEFYASLQGVLLSDNKLSSLIVHILRGMRLIF